MSLIFKSSRILTHYGKDLLKLASTKQLKQNFSVLNTARLQAGELKYTDKHEWIRLNGNVGTVGITDYAQDKLGEVVYVELPEVGAKLEQSNQFATLESVKAVSECYLPVTGKVLEVNQALIENPIKINKSPFDEGWLAKVEVLDKSEIDKLMDKSQYDEFLKSEQH